MSSSSTGGSARAVDALGQPSRAQRAAQLSGRGVALPASSTAPCCAARALGDRRGRRSADRPRACRRSRAPRRRRSARGPSSGANTAERGPTQTRASPPAQAQPLVVALAGREPRVQDGDGVAEAGAKRASGLRASARSRGRARSTPRPRASAASAAAQVDLGLARAGDAVQQQLAARRAVERAQRLGAAPPPGPAVSGGAGPRAPTADARPGAARPATCARRRPGRASRSASQRWSPGALAATVGPPRLASALEQPRVWLLGRAGAVAGERSAARRRSARATSSRLARAPRRCAGPGRQHQRQRRGPGSSSTRRPIHSAELDELGRRPPRRAPASARPGARAAARLSRPARRRRRACAAARTGLEHAADLDLAVGTQAVVERPAQRAACR